MTYCKQEENCTYIEWLVSVYNEAMNYFYKFFAYICFELSVVAKKAVSKEQSNNSIELFNNILYQRPGYVDDNMKNVYSAWTTIKDLIDKSFPYRLYKETLDDILYNDTVFELSENLDIVFLREIYSITNSYKETFNAFNEMGANRFLDESLYFDHILRKQTLNH